MAILALDEMAVVHNLTKSGISHHGVPAATSLARKQGLASALDDSPAGIRCCRRPFERVEAWPPLVKDIRPNHFHERHHLYLYFPSSQFSYPRVASHEVNRAFCVLEHGVLASVIHAHHL